MKLSKLILCLIVLLLILSQVLVAQEILHNFTGNDEGSKGSAIILKDHIYGIIRYYEYSSKIFKIHVNGSGFQILKVFGKETINGVPSSTLISYGDKLYGYAKSIGKKNLGGVFSMNRNGSDYQILHKSNKMSWWGSKLILINGYFYGSADGQGNHGIIYRIKPDGSNFEILRQFSKKDHLGYAPSWLYYDGQRIYSISSSRQNYYEGSIFSFLTDGSDFREVWNFNNSIYPPISVAIPMGDFLYGVLSSGTYEDGDLIYRVEKDGSGYEIIHESQEDYFLTGHPYVQNGDYLYGYIYYDDDQYLPNYWYGIFRQSLNGKHYEFLHNFRHKLEGYSPSNLMIDNGHIYSITSSGGKFGKGTIFRIPIKPRAGDVTVKITPLDAVKAGAKWRLSSQTDWRNSGESLKGLKTGEHFIQFKPVKGWQIPEGFPFTHTGGDAHTFSGSYSSWKELRNYGYLKLDFKPEAILEKWPAWKEVGSNSWNYKDGKVSLKGGIIKIKYKKLKGFVEPEPETVEIIKGKTTVLKRTYIKKK